MAKYLSNRQKNLKIGIGSYTESNTVLEVTGRVGIGTATAQSALDVVGNANFTGIVTANSFVKSGGTSSQFLKADGTVDTNTYLTSYTETDTLNSVTGRGNSTANGISVGFLTATSGNFSGIVTANAFVGDGSGLTNLPSGGGGTSSQWVTVAAGIHTTSNVGIGTTNPTSKLTVSGEVLLLRENTTQEGGQITFARALDNTSAYSIDCYNDSGQGTSPRLRFIDNVAGAERVSIDKTGNLLVGSGSATGTASQPLQVNGGAYVSGNLGVGVTNPAAKLHAISDSSAPSSTVTPTFFFSSGNSADAPAVEIRQGRYNKDVLTLSSNQSLSANLLRAHENGTDRLVLTGSGNLGLGIAPEQKLHVYDSADTVPARIQSNGTDSSIGFRAVSDATSYNTRCGSYQGNGFGVWTGNTIRSVLDNSGNLGVGVTNPQKVLEVITPTSDFASVGVRALGIGEWTGIHFGYRENNTAYRKSALIFERTDNAARGNIHILNNNDNNNASATLSDAKVTIQSSGNVGIGITNPTSKLSVVGDGNFTGVVTASSFSGNASSATQLQNSRTFEITGDIVASAISFNGTGNVSLAATIQPNSVALGSDTTGDYVSTISGTSNQITVTSGTGESSTPTLSIPSQFTAPQDVRVIRDLQVDRNLNVNGIITIGGTSANLFVNELNVYDADIVLGIRTDGNGNDISTDNTANHGGVAVASTEGTPLISLYDVGIGETNPATYKKFMWFKSGTFSGLGTDAWISNYAIGIGSTQVPYGVRLAAGGMQVTDSTISSPQLNISGVSTFTNGPVLIGSGTSTGTASQPLQVTGGAYVSGSVGMGITNPGAQIQIVAPSNTEPLRLHATTASYNYFTHKHHSSGDIAYFGAGGGAALTNGTSSDYVIRSQQGALIIATNGDNERLRVTSTGNVGINTTNPQYKLEVVGSFAATTKSFVIDHPTKPGRKLRYASLEGPENGVYIRGRSQESIIDLPDYWVGLVHEDSITVNLTPIGDSATPRVKSVLNNCIEVFSKEDGELDYYYTIYGERKDVEKLIVEI